MDFLLRPSRRRGRGAGWLAPVACTPQAIALPPPTGSGRSGRAERTASRRIGLSRAPNLGHAGQPEGQLAELDAQHKATPQRVADARALFPQASLDEFEPFGNRGKLRHVASGVEFVVAQEHVLEAVDPGKSGTEFFVVHGDRLLFLRPRGFDGSERGVPGELVAGVLEQSPSDTIRVVDARTGRVVRDEVQL